MANVGNAFRQLYSFEALANQNNTTAQQRQHFYAKKRCTGVCHLLYLAKGLIPSAHFGIKFPALLINWHLIRLSTEQLQTTVPRFTDSGAPQKLKHKKLVFQNPPVKHRKISTYIIAQLSQIRFVFLTQD